MKLVSKYDIKLLKGKDHFYSVEKHNPYLPSSTTILSRVYAKFLLVPWAAKQTSLYYERMMNLVYSERPIKKELIPVLARRAKRQHRYFKEKAGELGTRAHWYFEDAIFNPEKAKVLPGTEIAVDNFLDWKKHTKLNIIQGDTPVASIKYGYAGSLDAFALGEDGKIEVIDYKTSNYVGTDYAYQVGSYAEAAKETFGLDYLPKGHVIRFDKTRRKWEERRITNTFKALQGFLHCLELYKQSQEEFFEIVNKRKN